MKKKVLMFFTAVSILVSMNLINATDVQAKFKAN